MLFPYVSLCSTVSHASPICQSLQQFHMPVTEAQFQMPFPDVCHCNSLVLHAPPMSVTAAQFCQSLWHSFICSSYMPVITAQFHMPVSVAQFHMLFPYVCHCSTVLYVSQCSTALRALSICLSLQHSFTCQCGTVSHALPICLSL